MKQKVFITKYALSSGIREVEGELRFGGSACVVSYPEINSYRHYSKGQFRLTKEDAVKKAESMRIKKLGSLRKQIEKLEKLTFDK